MANFKRPNRKTNENELDTFNQNLRSQPWYQQARAGMGEGDLSRREQSQIEDLMRANNMQVEGGMHIDAGGNVNQKNRLVRNAAIAAGAAAGGYFAAPYIAGALGGAGGTTGAATTAATGGATAAAAPAAAAAVPAVVGAVKAGMNPLIAMMIMQGGGALLDAFSGDDETGERESFKGTSVDPEKMLAGASGNIAGLGKALVQKANKPVQLRGVTAQTPQGMSGGVLPFDIGLSGQDPAIADPSMLSLTGLNLPENEMFNFKDGNTITGPAQPSPQVFERNDMKYDAPPIDTTGMNAPFDIGGRTRQRQPGKYSQDDPEQIQKAFADLSKVYR